MGELSMFEVVVGFGNQTNNANKNIMSKVKQPNRSDRIEISPQFLHDCQNCEFLGRAEINLIKADIYFCKCGIRRGTLIARLSDQDSDYISCDIEYATPFNTWMCIAFAMYVYHLEVRSANPNKMGGRYFNDKGETVLDLP
jgi:hypothetical protein